MNTNVQHLYMISGLGADERVFQDIDFSGFQVTHIRWIAALAEESIEDYARRLSEQITTPNPILIGMSFGGIMAIEIAKQMICEKVILIASVKTSAELPFYMKWAGKLKLDKLVPATILKTSTLVSRWFFGIEKRKDKELFSIILKETDSVFLKWALNKIANWKNNTVPDKLYHIQGTKDRIFPLRYIKSAIMVPQGGHFMIVNKANELTRIIRGLL